MKKNVLLLFVFVSMNSVFAQNGQITPNAIKVPTANGTQSVASPSQGMVVYNQPDQSLYYRNSAEWVNLNSVAAATPNAPNIYYTITSTNPVIAGEITTGTHAGQSKVLSLNYAISVATTIGSSSGGAGAAKPVVAPLTFTKLRGISSLGFLEKMTRGGNIATIEFKYYDANDVLYYSVKLTTAFITKIDNSAPDSPGGFGSMETISMVSLAIGWKNYIPATPVSQGTYNPTTNVFTTTY